MSINSTLIDSFEVDDEQVIEVYLDQHFVYGKEEPSTFATIQLAVEGEEDAIGIWSVSETESLYKALGLAIAAAKEAINKAIANE